MLPRCCPLWAPPPPLKKPLGFLTPHGKCLKEEASVFHTLSSCFPCISILGPCIPSVAIHFPASVHLLPTHLPRSFHPLSSNVPSIFYEVFIHFPQSISIHLSLHFPTCPLPARTAPPACSINFPSSFHEVSIHFPDICDQFPVTFPFISPHVPEQRGQHPLHRLHHPKQCPPWMLNCCTLLQSFFHSFHRCIFQELCINCAHIFHPSPFPPFPAFFSSTPLHFHQFCILSVHPFSSPFHPAISHELFLSLFVSAVRLPSRSARAFSMHLGFSPVPSSFSCNSFDIHFPDISDPFPFPCPFISPHVPDRPGQHPLHRLHHPKQCPPWMLNCCTLLQSSFHSFHQCIFQELSINCPHIFHPSPFPPFPAFFSSTPLHFHQFCILFVHPFSSPFHPAISHGTAVPFTFCPCIFLHLGFSPVPSSFSCNSFDFHFVHFQSLQFPCISPSAPCFASPASIASSASSGMMLAMLGV